RDLLRAPRPAGRLQRLDQAAHTVPIRRLLQTISQQHDGRHGAPYAVSAKWVNAFSAISTPFASFKWVARCLKAARPGSSRNNFVTTRKMLGVVSPAATATPAATQRSMRFGWSSAIGTATQAHPQAIACNRLAPPFETTSGAWLITSARSACGNELKQRSRGFGSTALPD